MLFFNLAPIQHLFGLIAARPLVLDISHSRAQCFAFPMVIIGGISVEAIDCICSFKRCSIRYFVPKSELEGKLKSQDCHLKPLLCVCRGRH